MPGQQLQLRPHVSLPARSRLQDRREVLETGIARRSLLELFVVDQVLGIARSVDEPNAGVTRAVLQRQQHAAERHDPGEPGDEEQVRLERLRQHKVAVGAGQGQRIAGLPLEQIARPEPVRHPVQAEGD